MAADAEKKRPRERFEVDPPGVVTCRGCGSTDTRAHYSQPLANGERRVFRVCNQCEALLYFDRKEEG